MYASLNLGSGVADDLGAVRRNRDILGARFGVPVAFLHQVHSARVAGVDGPPEGGELAVAEADAAITARTDVGLAALVADCVPVLLAGEYVVAAVHAGRRGLLSGVLTATLASMAERGSPARYASIGPSICGSCYEVPEQMRAEVARVLPAAASTTSWGTPALDLAAGLRAQLAQAGVDAVEHHRLCTLEDTRFFSYRRDGVTGRFAGVIARRG